MNFAKFARTTVMAGLVMAALWGLPQAAQAEEIVAESGNQSGVCHGVTVLAWARVDGVSPSSDSDDPQNRSDSTATDVDDQTEQTVQSDPEWRYVPVRR